MSQSWIFPLNFAKFLRAKLLLEHLSDECLLLFGGIIMDVVLIEHIVWGIENVSDINIGNYCQVMIFI